MFECVKIAEEREGKKTFNKLSWHEVLNLFIEVVSHVRLSVCVCVCNQLRGKQRAERTPPKKTASS